MHRRVNQHARIRPSLQVKRGEERWCNAFLHNVRHLTSMEHTMNNQNQARISALALSVAITLAAVIGLTDASERQVQRPASINASVQCDAPNDDPELMRTDRGNEHHG